MSQAPQVNAEVINAIEVLAKSGHISVQEQADIFKKMLLSQHDKTAPLPVAVPAQVIPPASPKLKTPEQTQTKLAKATRKHPTLEEQLNAIAKIRLGVDCLEVARDMGVSDTYVRKLCVENGLKYVTRYGKTYRRITDDDVAKINKMLDAGCSVVEIQIAMNLSHSTVSLYRKVKTKLVK